MGCPPPLQQGRSPPALAPARLCRELPSAWTSRWRQRRPSGVAPARLGRKAAASQCFSRAFRARRPHRCTLCTLQKSARGDCASPRRRAARPRAQPASGLWKTPAAARPRRTRRTRLPRVAAVRAVVPSRSLRSGRLRIQAASSPRPPQLRRPSAASFSASSCESTLPTDQGPPTERQALFRHLAASVRRRATALGHPPARAWRRCSALRTACTGGPGSAPTAAPSSQSWLNRTPRRASAQRSRRSPPLSMPGRSPRRRRSARPRRFAAPRRFRRCGTRLANRSRLERRPRRRAAIRGRTRPRRRRPAAKSRSPRARGGPARALPLAARALRPTGRTSTG
ncbi:hypothetical protein M885DRAFT_530642 [Pelagophyceae sp. CCMP2097]|nr:hypothetical protein M885DRAFT_530642 [Pelagophyceae sp. CCMP2097]